jgi:hypothetical protein
MTNDSQTVSTLQTYDLLIPIELPRQATFNGRSGRGNVSLNNEIAFAFGSWNASFHDFGEKSYIILRLNLALTELEAILEDVFLMIAQASVALDVSIRPTREPFSILVKGERADLDNLCAFHSGEMPMAQLGDKSFQIGLPVELLSNALGQELSPNGSFSALQLFMDVDFEASPDSRFVLLSTILELLAERVLRDTEAQELIDKWKADAADSKRHDLAQAIDLMRSESIGSSIYSLVTEAANKAGCSEDHTKDFAKSARDAYRKRGKLLHAGISVTKDELSLLRSIVRLVLVGQTKGTPFTPIGNGIWEEKGKFR